MSKPIGDIAPSTSAISLHVPRLADFNQSDKSALISTHVVRASVRVIDFFVAALIGIVVAYVYVDETQVAANASYLIAISGTALCTVLAFELLGLYVVQRFTSILTQMPRVLLGWVTAFSVLIAAMFFFKVGDDFSRVWLATWFSVGGVALLSTRFVLAAVVRGWQRKGRMYRRAVVFGSGEVAQKVLAELESDPLSDIRICGVFDERDDDRVPALSQGYPLLGNLSDLMAFARATRIDLVIVALPVAAEKRIGMVLQTLSPLSAEIKLPGCASRFRLTANAYSRVGRVPMIDLIDKPISDWGMIAKWVFDQTISILALVALAPVMAVIAAAIKFESKGPVLFRQKRYGLNNELIEVFKFRSMYTEQSDANADRLVTRDDPRVTDVGRFIRKTSLDELPQLFNVLRGDLSLVGPRPHALQAKADDQLYTEAVDDYFSRHRVKPGITGWAQINGWRGETDTREKIEKRVEHDLYYIENWSVLLDLYILLMTPVALIKSENAY